MLDNKLSEVSREASMDAVTFWSALGTIATVVAAVISVLSYRQSSIKSKHLPTSEIVPRTENQVPNENIELNSANHTLSNVHLNVCVAGIHRGTLTIGGRGQVSGTVLGDIHVLEGRHVNISGTCRGNLVVEKGSRAVVSGVITGRIINRGGSVSGSGILGLA